MIAEARLAIELGDAASAETRLAQAEAIIRANQFETLRNDMLTASAELEALKGNWNDALLVRQTFLQANPTDLFIHASLAECLRELGRLDEAEDAIRRMIETLPGSASAYVELARILDARGNRAGAIEALDRALGFWSRAEPDFEPATEAQALREELAAA
jgi:tetratricopeptide (TPR) repeat protein